MLPFWRFFIEKRQFTILVIVGLVIVGTAAMLMMTKESTPEVQIPVGGVTVILPGASPEDVERLVTNKMEENLANLPDLSKLTSSSRERISAVVVEFEAAAGIQKSIQKLKDEGYKPVPHLPAEAKTPIVAEVNFVDQPIQMI